VLTASPGVLTFALGAVVDAADAAAGVLGVSEGVPLVVAGAAAAGVLTASPGVLTVPAGAVVGAAAAAAGVFGVSEGVPLVVAAAAAAGVLIASSGVLTVATGAAAAAVQCSEIMLSSVTTRLLSAAPPALCTMSFNVDLVWIAACRGSLCKPQHGQQGRYDDQQEYFLHEILREVSPCGGLNSAWNLIVLPILCRILARSGVRLKNLEHLSETP
jgi:hypothetical protein